MFTSDFLKQFYSYRRPFQEVEGYRIRAEEDGTNTVFVNALGVNPEDVKIDVVSEYPKTQVLSITGTTSNDVWGEDFSVNVSFYVRKPIKRIVKLFRFGLIILKIEFDAPVKPQIEIVDGEDVVKRLIHPDNNPDPQL